MMGDSSLMTRDEDYSYFYCSWQKPCVATQILMLVLLGIMFLMGVFIMIDGLIQVVHTIRKD
jgi:hypothetical protein